MGNMHLVTGYLGQEHITAVDQAAFNAALIGTGQFVLDKGKVFEVQVISNNHIRILDGELMMQGRFVRLDPGTYVDLNIENGTQGMKRNDLVAVRYTKDTVTGVEGVNLVVIKGTAANNPVDPEHTEGDITTGTAVLHEYPLWRIPLDGLNVGEPVPLFGEPFMDSMRTLPGIRRSVETIQGDVNKQLAEQTAAINKKIEGINSYLKDETLSNETKALYGFGASAVPDDAFRKLREHASPKIGDITFTYRNDLGEDYALCNGAWFKPSDYPELAAIMPDPPSAFACSEWSSLREPSTNGISKAWRFISSICEGGGYQVALAVHYGSDNYSVPALIYSKDWFKTYGVVEFTYNGSTGFANYAYEGGIVRYIDGVFVAAFTDGHYHLFYASTTNIEVNTLEVESFTNHNVYEVFDIWKENGMYYLAASGNSTWNSDREYNYYPYIFSAVSLTNITWSSMLVSNEKLFGPERFFRVNGRYVFVCYSNNNGSYSVVHSTNVAGGWTSYTLTLPEGTGKWYSSDTMYYYPDDDIWVMYLYQQIDNDHYMGLIWSHDITANKWTYVRELEKTSGSHSKFPSNFIKVPTGTYIAMYDNGKYMHEIGDFKDPSTWKYISLVPDYMDESVLSGVYDYNSQGFAGCMYCPDAHPILVDGSWILWTLRPAKASGANGLIFKSPLYALPVCDNPMLRAYMKVKETET